MRPPDDACRPVVCPPAPAGPVACRLCQVPVAPGPAAAPLVSLGAPPVCPACVPVVLGSAREFRRLVRPVAGPAAPPEQAARPPAAGTDAAPHVKWARSIARGVRHDYRFQAGSQEEQDIEGAAYLALCQLAARYDPAAVRPRPGDAADPSPGFRGFAHQTVRKECQREAARLRNAGTYHTRREDEHEPLRVSHLSTMLTPDGDPWQAAAPEPADDAPGVVG